MQRTNRILLLCTILLSTTCFFFILRSFQASQEMEHPSVRFTRPLEMGEKRQRMVVSISTFPGRIERIRGTLESIASQDRIPDAIYLHIPNGVARLNISGELSSSDLLLLQEWQDKIIVKRVQDYGPATKLLGSLLFEKDPETLIVTMDDDVIYKSDLLSRIEQTSIIAPNHIITSGCEYTTDAIYNKWASKESEGVCNGWPLGYLGAAYRVKWFDPSIFDFSLVPSGCRLHDDVYLGGWLLFNREVRPYIIGDYFPMLKHGEYDQFSIHSVKDTQSAYQIPCLKYYDYLM